MQNLWKCPLEKEAKSFHVHRVHLSLQGLVTDSHMTHDPSATTAYNTSDPTLESGFHCLLRPVFIACSVGPKQHPDRRRILPVISAAEGTVDRNL